MKSIMVLLLSAMGIQTSWGMVGNQDNKDKYTNTYCTALYYSENEINLLKITDDGKVKIAKAKEQCVQIMNNNWNKVSQLFNNQTLAKIQDANNSEFFDGFREKIKNVIVINCNNDQKCIQESNPAFNSDKYSDGIELF